jgi:hypothetical protein
VDWQKTHLERGTASDDHERPCLALHATHVLIAEVLSVVIYSQHLFIRLIERHANRVTRCKHSTNPHTRQAQTTRRVSHSLCLALPVAGRGSLLTAAAAGDCCVYLSQPIGMLGSHRTIELVLLE